MNLYEVQRDETTVGLAYETAGGHIYVYVPNTGKFHRSDAQAEDFYVHQESTYRPVTRAEARELMLAEVGKMDGRTRPHLLERFVEDPDARDPVDVVGEAPVAARSVRQLAAARAAALAQAEPGDWLTWKVYPREKKQTAQVAANDIRAGKIVALRRLGKMDARVDDLGPEVHVMVSLAVTDPA